MTIYTQYGEPTKIISVGDRPELVIIEVKTGGSVRHRSRSVYNLLADGGIKEIKDALSRLGYDVKQLFKEQK